MFYSGWCVSRCWQLKYVLFSPLFGEDEPIFDEHIAYFSIGLKPPRLSGKSFGDFGAISNS